jgi:hypothetical protein
MLAVEDTPILNVSILKCEELVILPWVCLLLSTFLYIFNDHSKGTLGLSIILNGAQLVVAAVLTQTLYKIEAVTFEFKNSFPNIFEFSSYYDEYSENISRLRNQYFCFALAQIPLYYYLIHRSVKVKRELYLMVFSFCFFATSHTIMRIFTNNLFSYSVSRNNLSMVS